MNVTVTVTVDVEKKKRKRTKATADEIVEYVAKCMDTFVAVAEGARAVFEGAIMENTILNIFSQNS